MLLKTTKMPCKVKNACGCKCIFISNVLHRMSLTREFLDIKWHWKMLSDPTQQPSLKYLQFSSFLHYEILRKGSPRLDDTYHGGENGSVQIQGSSTSTGYRENVNGLSVNSSVYLYIHFKCQGTLYLISCNKKTHHCLSTRAEDSLITVRSYRHEK